MLGINSPQEIITGEFAKAIRDSLYRHLNHQLTDEEKEIEQKMEEVRREWKTVLILEDGRRIPLFKE